MFLSPLKKYSEKLFNLSFICFVVAVWLLSYVIALPFYLFGADLPDPIGEYDIVVRIIGGIFIAPIFETLIFQSFLIYIFTKVLIKNRYFAIFISALAFGLVHYYSIVYVLYAFFMGLYFAWTYLNYYEKRGFSHAFWAITLVHALWNTVVEILLTHFPST